MKNAAIIFLMGLFMLISALVLAAIITGDIPLYAIIGPILFFTAFVWYTFSRNSRLLKQFHPEEFPQGKLSLEETNKFTDKLFKDSFKFGCLPILVMIILLIIW